MSISISSVSPLNLVFKLLNDFGLLIVVAASLGPYLRCLLYSEWYIDELFAIVRNEDAKNESSWEKVFSNDFWGNPLFDPNGHWTHKSYRPLTVLLYCLEFWFTGEIKPQPLRAFSAGVHTLNAVLVWMVMRRLTVLRGGSLQSAGWIATLVACHFGAQPVHVENIVYLVGRADMVATVIFAVCILLYLEDFDKSKKQSAGDHLDVRNNVVSRTSLTLVPIFSILAILGGFSKESGFMVMPLLVTMEVTSKRRNCFRNGMIILATFLCIIAFRSKITKGTSTGFSFVDTPVQYNDSIFVRGATYMFQHAFYMKLCLMPWHLSWDYSYDTIPLLREHIFDYRFLLVCSMYLLLLCSVSWFANKKKSHEGLIGLFWVVVPFLPASNLFFIVGVTVGERLVYCSTAGVSIAIGMWAYEITKDKFRKQEYESVEQFIASAEVLTDKSNSSAIDSNNSSTIDSSPSDGGEKMNTNKFITEKTDSGYDVISSCEGKMALSAPIAFFGKKTFGLAFLTAWVTIFVVNCAIRVGHWQSRYILFDVDSQNWPLGLKGHHQWATVLHTLNRYEEALWHFEKTIQIHDDNALTDYCIAQIYIETSQMDKALHTFEKIMRGHGIGFGSYNTFALFADFGFVLAIHKRWDEAVHWLEKGLERNKDVPHAWNALGYTYAHLEMLQEAQDAFAEGLKWDPQQAYLWNNLAAVWISAGAFENAASAIIKAAELDMTVPAIQHNYSMMAEIEQGKFEVLQHAKPAYDMFYNRYQ